MSNKKKNSDTAGNDVDEALETQDVTSKETTEDSDTAGNASVKSNSPFGIPHNKYDGMDRKWWEKGNS